MTTISFRIVNIQNKMETKDGMFYSLQEESSFNLPMVQIELRIGHKLKIFMKNSYGTENRRQ